MAREYENSAMAAITSRVVACLWLRFIQCKDAASPEGIRENSPALSLEQGYGAVAFFLGHEGEVEANLRETEKQWEAFRKIADPLSPTLIDRFKSARQGRTTR